jgi:hypothetical protein
VIGLWAQLIFSLSACTTPVDPPISDPLLVCVPTTFGLAKLDLAEASGAVWVKTDSLQGWLIGADNGNGGQAVIIGAEGELLAELNLPLDEGAGDDLEGMAWSKAGQLVGLTSAGYLRRWTLTDTGGHLTQLASPISSDPQWICEPHESNCGANWEGLCLDPAPLEGGCAGFAVSKELGELFCVREGESGFVLDADVRIKVTKKKRLSGCDYALEPPHHLVVAGNDTSDDALWQILGHREPLGASAELLEVGGSLNQEALAFGPGGALLSFGDEEEISGLGSAIAAFFCQ